ncbi:hypothetical protein LBMAG35_15580 [Chlorobiota bacterium]|nr:hypothetical protein LBMAG35_15580 [Chlorobiota bacterium]
MNLKSLFILCILLPFFCIPLFSQSELWSPRGIGGGGALFSISISPHNPANVHVSCDMSQLFNSVDFGESWNVYHFTSVGGSNITGKIAYTSDSNVQYTISRFGDAKVPVKTVDGGKQWTPLTDPTNGSAFYLLANPQSTMELLLTDYTTIFRSMDGGKSWRILFKELTPNSEGCLLLGALWDPSFKCIITQAGVYISSDNGNSYVKDQRFALPSLEGMNSFAYAKSGNNYRFMCITHSLSGIYPGKTGAEFRDFMNIYTLDIQNGIPSSWVSRTSSLPTGTKPFFCGMSATNTDILYLAGGNAMNHPSVLKSIDGGKTFISVFNTVNNNNIKTGWSGTGGDRDWTYGEYALGFDVSPNDPNYVAVSDLGFIHLSSSGGSDWFAGYTASNTLNKTGSPITQNKSYVSNGLENTTAWNLHWVNDSTILCANSDIKGTRSTNGGNSWQHVYNSFGINSVYAIAQYRNTIYAATSTIHDIYQSTYLTDSRIDNGKGSILVSTDNGNTWSNKWSLNYGVVWIALDANDSNTMYAALAHSINGGIYVNNDIQHGGQWKKLSSPPRTEGHPFNIRSLKDGSLLVTYSGRRVGNAFTASSGVYLSTDKGNTWIDKSSAEMKYWTKDIIIDPEDPQQQTWYVGVWSGWGGAPNNVGGLYKTKNRGSSWTRILDLPSRSQNTNRVTSCTIHPSNHKEMYVTTETDGLWYSDNIQVETPQFKQIASFPFRQPERVCFNPRNPEEVWVTTFGNGLRVGHRNQQPPSVQWVNPTMDTTIAYSDTVPSIQIMWSGKTDASIMQSQIRYAPDSTFLFKTDTITTKGYNYQLPKTIPGNDSSWYLQARVYDGNQWSAWTTALCLTYKKTNPKPVVSWESPMNDTTITYSLTPPLLLIQWSGTPVGDIQESQLRYSTGATFQFVTDTVTTNTFSLQIPSSIPGKDSLWFLQLRVQSNKQWSDWSRIIQLRYKKEAVSWIDDISDMNYFIQYNPATSTIECSDPEEFKAEIYSLDGKLVMIGTFMQRIDIRFLSKGTYMLMFIKKGKPPISFQFVR